MMAGFGESKDSFSSVSLPAFGAPMPIAVKPSSHSLLEEEKTTRLR